MNTHRLLTLTLTALLALGVALIAEEDKGKKGKGKAKETADPPGTTTYMNEFRARFDKMDLNKDGYIEKTEAAVAFRGAGAKAYDHFYTKKEKSKTEDSKESQKDKSQSEKTETEKSKTEKSDKQPDYSKIPDYQFLVQLDKDKDDQVSRDEYLEWAREVAIQMREHAEAVRDAQKLQKELAQLKAKDKNRQNVESKLKKQQQQIDRLQQQLKHNERFNGSPKK